MRAAEDPGGGGSARRLLAVLALVQLVCVVDFTMLLPLGPDLLVPLGLTADDLPMLVGAGTLSAGAAGLLGGGWLERAPGRRALVGLLLVVAFAELLAVLAGNGPMMMLARVLGGAATGQAGALTLVIVSDAVPEARRGRAIGALMAANGVAAIVGVPFGLWAAQAWGWRAPFIVVGVAALVVAGLVYAGLPPLRDRPRATGSRLAPLRSPRVRGALALTLIAMTSSFLLNPNLSAFIQYNLGYPRDSLPTMYAVAGGFALLASQVTGRAVDRWGSFRVGGVAVVVFAGVVFGVVVAEGAVPVLVGFVLLLSSIQSRNVSVRTLATRAPAADERGRFMSLLSTAQQLGAATGAMTSARLVSPGTDGRLAGMPLIGLISVFVALSTIPLLAWLERRIEADHRAAG